jgi:hypothetical protein
VVTVINDKFPPALTHSLHGFKQVIKDIRLGTWNIKSLQYRNAD